MDELCVARSVLNKIKQINRYTEETNKGLERYTELLIDHSRQEYLLEQFILDTYKTNK